MKRVALKTLGIVFVCSIGLVLTALSQSENRTTKDSLTLRSMKEILGGDGCIEDCSGGWVRTVDAQNCVNQSIPCGGGVCEVDVSYACVLSPGSENEYCADVNVLLADSDCDSVGGGCNCVDSTTEFLTFPVKECRSR